VTHVVGGVTPIGHRVTPFAEDVPLVGPVMLVMAVLAVLAVLTPIIRRVAPIRLAV